MYVPGFPGPSDSEPFCEAHRKQAESASPRRFRPLGPSLWGVGRLHLQKVLSIPLSLSERFHPYQCLVEYFYDTTDVRLVFPINALDLLEWGYSNKADTRVPGKPECRHCQDLQICYGILWELRAKASRLQDLQIPGLWEFYFYLSSAASDKNSMMIRMARVTTIIPITTERISKSLILRQIQLR